MAEMIISFPSVIRFKSKKFLQIPAMKMHSILPTLSTLKFLNTIFRCLLFCFYLKRNPENFASFSQVDQILPLGDVILPLYLKCEVAAVGKDNIASSTKLSQPKGHGATCLF